ncbi:hypothetical protein ACFQ3W_11895 [Paenibacillus puldeungensis]|uniref:Uncharacterized protein n=1 Tax=Paenibacillus puldeungensis TaxID=696536 RepID=A0ABW3RWX5_9BACL
MITTIFMIYNLDLIALAIYPDKKTSLLQAQICVTKKSQSKVSDLEAE